ncbi:MAG: HAMP domain-containing sensor histidine kinase [Verrucomicrobiales bacterium]|nr:HAMP domain-containing sensor histidine kinase [Verrucomicrobiales bacterium]
MKKQILSSKSKSLAVASVEEILTAHGGLELLVQQLLLLSRLDAGNYSTDVAPIHLEQVLKSCWKRAFAISEKKRHVIKWDVPQPFPECNANQLLLEAILGNLFENAACYTPVEGKITIRIRQDKRGLRFSVINSNPGLVQSDLKRLFQPFWRKTQAVPERNHAGIGLSLCKRIAEVFESEMEVALREEDVEFGFVLPRSKTDDSGQSFS